MGCVNAAGHVLPPMIIFDAKNLNHAWTMNEVPGTKYGLSNKGWITTELFEGRFTELFLPCAVSARPLLLLLDGHSTHYQPDVVRFAHEHDVIMLCLPPHTSHETQPLDCGVFGPLKCHWSSTCHDFFQNNPGKVVIKFNFNTLFSQAWLKAISPINVISGFKTCSMHPYNLAAIKVPGDSLKPMNSAAPRTDAISNATSSVAPDTHAISNATSSAAPHIDAISNASSPKQVCDTQKFTDKQLPLLTKSCLLEQIQAESLLLVLLQTQSVQPVQNPIRLVIVHQKLARLYQNTWLDPQTLPLRREVSRELDC